jgi:4-aminobutyrate aminotransferase-like enzyme
MVNDEELIKKDSIYCSYGDTVHYAEPPKIFRGCNGSFLYDSADIPYLDLQMWYSAASFGYKNPRLHKTLQTQMDTLPQLACQYLHEEKVLLAEKICLANMKRFEEKGRIHFNVGGAQAIEDALKLVRNAKEKNLMFAFMGSYHGRTLGDWWGGELRFGSLSDTLDCRVRREFDADVVPAFQLNHDVIVRVYF